MDIVNAVLPSHIVASVAELGGYPYTPNALPFYSIEQTDDDQFDSRFLRRLGAGRLFYIVDKAEYVTADDTTIGFDDLRSDFHQSFGTYRLHAEPTLLAPEFYDSAYAQPQPWQELNTNFNLGLQPFGPYRSFFNQGTKGNYQNFYEMCPISGSTSYYSSSRIPQFYSADGNCTETTFSPNLDARSYKEYKPFVVENLGYSRSYFYGVSY